MILSDLLGAPVLDPDGERLGRVIDARFVLEGRTTPAVARLSGLIVSPRTASSYLGYERRRANRPMLVDRYLRWRHRGSFLVPWDAVAELREDRVVLRPGYERRPATLP